MCGTRVTGGRMSHKVIKKVTVENSNRNNLSERGDPQGNCIRDGLTP